MADAYVTEAEVEEELGKDVVDAIQGFTSIDLTAKIEKATALIQGYLRNNGYSTPTTTTDETVKLAVIGALWESLGSTPEANLPPPSDTHPARVAYLGILSGEVTLDPAGSHALSKIAAKGGWKFSDRTDSATDYIKKTTTKEMLGY